jgi:hypothetical protein
VTEPASGVEAGLRIVWGDLPTGIQVVAYGNPPRFFVNQAWWLGASTGEQREALTTAVGHGWAPGVLMWGWGNGEPFNPTADWLTLLCAALGLG